MGKNTFKIEVAGITRSVSVNIANPTIEDGFWSDPNTGGGIKEGIYGDKVKFTLKTIDIVDDTVLNFILFDYDGDYNPDDELSRSFSTKVKNNMAELEFVPDIKWEESAKYETDKIVEVYFKIEAEINGKKITAELPKKEDKYLKIFGKPEIITVLIELPHTGYTDKLNSKGLAGHSAIMIGSEYYDFGPQPGEPFFSDGRPWWDTMSKSGNLKRTDVIGILGDIQTRKDWDIVGEVYLIDIEVSKKEKNKIEKWWINKYAKLGTYSVIPIFGEQCTSNVRISLSESTNVIDKFTVKVQTPKGLFDLLTNSAKHTYGKNRNKQLKISKKFNQI